MTFEAVARAWHTMRSETLDPGHASRLMARLERDMFPAFGRKKVGDVTSADVLAMIRRVDVGRRLKGHVSQIYRFAKPNGWIKQNPAADLEDALKPSRACSTWRASGSGNCRR